MPSLSPAATAATRAGRTPVDLGYLVGAPARRRAAARRPCEPALLYPELPFPPPSLGGDRVAFARACFLQDLATLRAGQRLAVETYKQSIDATEINFFSRAVIHAKSELKRSFTDWMEATGGMTGIAEVSV